MGNVPRKKRKAKLPPPTVIHDPVTYDNHYEEDPSDPHYILPFLRRTVGPRFHRRQIDGHRK